MEHQEERHAPPEKPPLPSIVDWLGPGPTVTIILTVGSAVVVGALSLWSLVGAHASQLAILSDRTLDHEERLREQELRPPRLAPLVDDVKAKCDAIGERVPVIAEQVKSLESRIVGVGPNGWHRADHELYAKMMDERNDRIRTRLEIIEQRQDKVCERVRECKGQK